MSLLKYLGSEDNLLNQQPTNNSAIKIPSPILSSKELIISQAKQIGFLIVQLIALWL